MKKIIGFITLSLLFVGSVEAGRMKEIYTMTNEAVELELGLYQDQGLITITGHKFANAESADGIAVETKIIANTNGKVLYTCVTQFEKTERFFRDYKTTCN